MGTDFLTEMQAWFDKNGLVKPQADWMDSGNGVLYTSVYVALALELNPYNRMRVPYLPLVKPCFKRRGLLMRTPQNTYGLESWDDYLGLAVACLVLDDQSTPREVLWYGIRHLGFYNNTDTFTRDAFLGRFPQVWALMWIAAFPFLKWPLYPILKLIARFMDPPATDASGIQLAWLYLWACRYLGFTFEKYYPITMALSYAYLSYYGEGHPFINAAKIVSGKAYLYE